MRLLRLLCLEPNEISPFWLALRCSLGRPGVWKALRRLESTGIVERTEGQYGFPHYRLASTHPLAGALRELFEREARSGQSPVMRAAAEQRAARLRARFDVRPAMEWQVEDSG